jgi:crotonobetainyl-CoA:carnitine CoA-transferase CaiB-like acyl-CoA transferase
VPDEFTREAVGRGEIAAAHSAAAHYDRGVPSRCGEAMSSPRPLSGLVVLEIGHSVAAPYAGMILGELGAEVIKVENPKGGDPARGWGPPFSGDAATAFHAFNRAKRGIAVDLADPAAAARLRRLVRERADVLLHNLKFGTLERYGLGAASLLAEKPGLVCCNIGAFGTLGPLHDRPGYDPMMQAYGGLMSLLGEDGRPPVRVTVSIIDIATAMWAVIGILAKLAERRATGRGGIVDASLYETTLAWMSLPIAAYLASGDIPARCGSGIEQIVPYQAFAAADGHLMVAAGNDNLFRRLADTVDRPSLAEDPRFRTNKDRVHNRASLIAILEGVFGREPIAVWRQRLDAAGIPNAPIRNLEEVVSDMQTAALGIIQQAPAGAAPTVPSLVGLPLSFDGTRPPFAKPAPRLGEDDADILARAG